MKKYFCEFLGTFILVLLGISSVGSSNCSISLSIFNIPLIPDLLYTLDNVPF